MDVNNNIGNDVLKGLRCTNTIVPYMQIVRDNIVTYKMYLS